MAAKRNTDHPMKRAKKPAPAPAAPAAAVGIPYFAATLAFDERGAFLSGPCPTCGVEITCRDQKDDESISLREYQQHHAEQHAGKPAPASPAPAKKPAPFRALPAPYSAKVEGRWVVVDPVEQIAGWLYEEDARGYALGLAQVHRMRVAIVDRETGTVEWADPPSAGA